MSAASTETIMAALFALAQTVNTASTPFTIMSRRMRHFKDVGPDDMPALFQFQRAAFRTEGGVRGLPKQMFKVSWMVYLPGSTGLDDAVSPTLNNYYDDLTSVLLRNLDPQNRNTLGGLVTNCYVDGDVFTDEGLLSTQSLIMIPITILTGGI